MDLQVFLDMGLDRSEAQIYLALLELGSSLASTVTRKTKIDRSVVYKKLDSLIDKGFVSYHVRENRKYFQATDPSKLLDLMGDREEKLKELLPELTSMRAPQTEETKVEVYRGREGYKTIVNDMLRHVGEADKTFYDIGYTGIGPDIAGFWYETWSKRRVEMGIKRKYIVANQALGKTAVKQPLTEIRVLPKDLHFPSSLVVYGKRTAMLYYNQGEFTGVIIESEGIAKSNRGFFEALWRKSEKIDAKAK